MLQEQVIFQQEQQDEQEYQMFQGIPEDEIETYHLYLWKEEPRRPFWHTWHWPTFNVGRMPNVFMQV